MVYNGCAQVLHLCCSVARILHVGNSSEGNVYTFIKGNPPSPPAHREYYILTAHRVIKHHTGIIGTYQIVSATITRKATKLPPPTLHAPYILALFHVFNKVCQHLLFPWLCNLPSTALIQEIKERMLRAQSLPRQS